MTNRLTSLAGALAVAAMLVGLPLGAGAPDATAPAGDTVAYWSTHSGTETLLPMVFALCAGAVVAFGAGLREALREDSGERLASVAFAGTVIAATGILTIVSVSFTAAHTAGEVAPQATQALSALSADFFFPMAAGFGLMMIAGGLGMTRASLLPAWLGWVSVLVGAAAFTPAGIVAFVGTPVWILAVSACLYPRRARTVAPPSPTVGPEQSSTIRRAIDLSARG